MRQLVPILLNGRLVQMFLENGEPSVTIEIPMRHYPVGGLLRETDPYEKKFALTVFGRCTKVWTEQRGISEERVVETFYTCTNPRVSFENEIIPVIT